MSEALIVPEKPDWRCLWGIHCWEKFASGADEHRRCRRCERIDSYFNSFYGGRWETLKSGKFTAWIKYQEKLAHSRLSPELRDFVDKVKRSDIAMSSYPGKTE